MDKIELWIEKKKKEWQEIAKIEVKKEFMEEVLEDAKKDYRDLAYWKNKFTNDSKWLDYYKTKNDDGKR